MRQKTRIPAPRYFLAILLVVAPMATAQEEPAADFEGLIEVTEVLLDVMVTDRSGAPVTGLDASDFEVKEDGDPVELTGVDFYTTRYGPDGEVLTADGAVPSSRYFIFFFDDVRPGSVGSRLIRQQLDAARDSRRWVDEGMLPSDWVAVLSYDVKLKIHLDFTQDRQAIRDALENAARGKDPEKGIGRRGRVLPPSGAPSLLRNLPQGKTLRKQTSRIYDAIRLVAEAAGYVVGRKNLLLFSFGFGELRTGSPISEPDRRYYPQMEEALNDHNVAVYPIDLTPADFEHLQTHFLSKLAHDTGGTYYRNFISFVTPLEQIAEENTGYYLLSYRSEHPAREAGYQEVKVKVPGRDVKVRARRGYRFGSEHS